MIANLGYGALVVTLLVSLFGVGAAFYGARTNKKAWVDSARNAMLLTFPLLTLAALCIIYLADQRPLRGRICRLGDQQQHADLPADHCLVGRAGWFAGVLVLADVCLCHCGHPAQMGPRPRVPALGDRGLPGHPGLFPDPDHLLRESLCPLLAARRWECRSRPCSTAGAHALDPGRWARAEPPAAPSRHDHPPAHALPGFCFLRDPICFCHCRPDHRAHRRPLDPHHPPLDAGRLAVPLAGTDAGRALGL